MDKSGEELRRWIEYTEQGDVGLLRGEDFSQALALGPGDALSSFSHYVVERVEEFDPTSVLLLMTNGAVRVVDKRVPLKLQSRGNGVFPGDLKTGSVLMTGDVVSGIKDTYINKQDGHMAIGVNVAGGPWVSEELLIPADLEVAVAEFNYSEIVGKPMSDLGMIALRNVMAVGNDRSRQAI